MKKVILKINETSYTLKFGVACLVNLGKSWGFETINQTLAKIAKLHQSNIDDVSFEFVEIIAQLTAVAIKTNLENELSAEDETDIPDVLFNNPEKLAEITAAFLESLPKGKSEAEGKQKATKVASKKI